MSSDLDLLTPMKVESMGPIHWAIAQSRSPKPGESATQALSATAHQLAQQLADSLEGRSIVRGLARYGMGKPYWPESDLFFNVSHSAGLAAAAVSPQSEIGVDIQEEIPPSVIDDVKNLTCSETEARVLEEVSDPSQWFTELWTAKEAVFKALGEGPYQSPRDLQVTDSEGRFLPIYSAGPGRSVRIVAVHWVVALGKRFCLILTEVI